MSGSFFPGKDLGGGFTVKTKQIRLLVGIFLIGFAAWKGMEYHYREMEQPITLVYAVQDTDRTNSTPALAEENYMKYQYDTPNTENPTYTTQDENTTTSSQTQESHVSQTSSHQTQSPQQSLPKPQAQQEASLPPVQQTEQPEQSSSSKAPDKGMGTWDINQATQDQLEQVKGIGEVKARAILDYIRSHGPITDMNQLLNINGIGEKTLESIKQKFSVQ